jgi:uncharacterized protein involved in exopolysaccharide biosynthesis
MIRKLLEALFRYKWLILLPPIVIPAVVTPIALATAPVYYESVVGIWVDQPTYLAVKDPTTQYTSPAAAQTSALTEMLHTRTFDLDVASRTPLASVASSRGGDARIQDLFDKGILVAPSGSHLVVLKARAPTGQLAAQIAQAVVDAYQDQTSSQQLDQSGVAISFYQTQLQSAQDQLSRSSQELSQYATAMGYDGSADATVGPAQNGTLSASALDPKFAQLQSSVNFAQQQVDQARTSLQQAQLASAAAVQGGQVGFQVIDPPQVPTAPASNSKSVVVFAVASLVVGFGLSGMLLVLLVAGDRSIRRDADLASSFPVLGVVPQLSMKRAPKFARRTTTRRAIGFVAGTALPAPRGVAK